MTVRVNPLGMLTVLGDLSGSCSPCVEYVAPQGRADVSRLVKVTRGLRPGWTPLRTLAAGLVTVVQGQLPSRRLLILEETQHLLQRRRGAPRTAFARGLTVFSLLPSLPSRESIIILM